MSVSAGTPPGAGEPPAPGGTGVPPAPDDPRARKDHLIPEPRQSAAVILVREGESDTSAGPLEVCLLRRHRRSGFMASAFVFPGGVAEPEDAGDLRVTAARELAEEAGVTVDPAALLYFAHWVTPSFEPRRYSARFYVGVLPPGQVAAFDRVETVEQIWVTPGDALARAGELKLPPPQVRTLWEMAPAAGRGLDALRELCRTRAADPHPILPRACALDGGGFALLLPWDPDYEARGQGAALPMPAGHPLAVGPSRFVLEGQAWKNIDAPGSDRAG